MNVQAGKLASLIQRIVAQGMETRLNDPRLKYVTITEVRVTNDLQIARIYWTDSASFSGNKSKQDKRSIDKKQITTALNQARGRLRSLVGEHAGLRLTPQLEFVYDELPQEAKDIEAALNAAQKRDVDLETSRQGKQYAGAEDPYENSSYKDSSEEADDNISD